MTENEIATVVLDAAFEINSEPGPGLLESVYEATAFRLYGKILDWISVSDLI